MNNIIKITDSFPNPQTLVDSEVCNHYKLLQALKKEVEAMENCYEEELNIRTNQENTVFNDYVLTYKSSNLFDKIRAKEYLTKQFSKEEIKKNYAKVEIDYKKLQSDIKKEYTDRDYKELFCKKSKPRIKVELKKQ